MIKYYLKILIFYLFFISSSYSDIISKIIIDGNKRLSESSISVLTGVSIGDNLNENDLNNILKDLYETNFFNDVKISLSDGELFVSVIENPIIETIDINGIKNKGLSNAIADRIYLKNRSSFSNEMLENDINLIKNILRQNGYYFSKVQTSTTINEKLNSINILIDVDLGQKAKINNIKFIGKKFFKDKELRSIIASEEHKFWKFLSRNVYLNNNLINLDTRLLENFYRNFGFKDVIVQNSLAQLDERGSFDLIFNIDSGKKYFFNKFTLNLPEDYNKNDFSSLDKIFKKNYQKEYSLTLIEKILDEIEYITSVKLYDFIDADIQEIVVDNNSLDLIIDIKESEPFYVEKINILGNFTTYEEVIRNKLIVDEGDPLNNILLTKSIDNIRSTRLFKNVSYEIKDDNSNRNLKIIDIRVEEQPTGEITLGAGFGTDGGTFGGGIIEKNFLGKGINLNTNFELSDNSFKGQFIYSRPNFAYTDNTLFTSIKSVTSDFLSDYGYEIDTIGASIGTEFEQYESLYFRPELEFEIENLKTNSKSSNALKKQEGSYEDLYFNYGLTYDQRNSKFKPSNGYIYSFNQNLPLISKTNELMNNFTFTNYNTVNKKDEMVLRSSIYLKSVNSLNSDEDVRISKRAQVPGNRLRGFTRGKIGPVDNSEYVGGNYAASLNFSTNIPYLFRENDNLDINFFLDAANVWGVDYNSDIDDSNLIRSSSGIGIDFLTPVGPLNFSYALPLKKASTDKTESFRFNLGTTF
jgi:outer membrane protein insertion porin family